MITRRRALAFEDGPDVHERLARAMAAHALFGPRVAPARLGRFQLVRQLGRGASGVVYAAVDLERGGDVALKVLADFDHRAIAQLKHEFRALADVVHPNLVGLHELFVGTEAPFFTMDLVTGTTFESWVRPEGLLCESRLRDALAQLIAGVLAIHDAGKVHGDLKPSNVIVNESGQLFVLDFGLVSELGQPKSAPSLSGLIGTPAYMAPEYASDAAPTAARDFYAIGVMLFEALTGTLPFASPSGAPARIQHAGDVTDPRKLAMAAPADLSELCVALLRRDPTERARREHLLALTRARAAGGDAGQAESFTAGGFVGRQRELGLLAAALAEVSSRSAPVCAFVSGASGMGKSTLAARFVELLPAETLVLRGSCHELESLPFKLLDGVVDDLARFLGRLPSAQLRALLPTHFPALLRLFPALGFVQNLALAESTDAADDPRELQLHAFRAFRGLLARIAEQRAVVIIVDDLQWGDIDGARLLRALLSSRSSPPVLFVGTHRSHQELPECLRLLQGLATSPRTRVVSFELGPLEPEAAASLAQSLIGSSCADTLGRRIAAEADFVPLFVLELAAHLRTRPLEEHEGERAPSVRLEEVLAERVAQLGDKARQLLEVLSVAAAPLEAKVAVTAATLPAGDHVELLRLRRARLVRAAGASTDVAETYHDRVRETVVGAMSIARVRQTHARIAHALEAHGVFDAERLIVHYVGACDHARAGQTAVLAGHTAASKLAFHHAAELFGKACELLPEAERRTQRVVEHLAQALANAGRGADAAAAYLEAARELEPRSAARMTLMAAGQYWASGRTEEARALTRKVFADARVRAPASRAGAMLALAWERARLHVRGFAWSRSRAAHTDADNLRLEAMAELGSRLALLEPVRGAVLQTRLLREALSLGNPELAQYGLAWEVWNTAVMGGKKSERRTARLMPLLHRLRDELATPYASALSAVAEASRSFARGDSYQQALAHAGRAERLFAERCPGAFWERTMTATLQLTCLFFTGSLAELAARARENLEEAEARDDRTMFLHVASSACVELLMRDDPQGALDFLDAQKAWLEPEHTVSRQLWLLWKLLALIYAGRAREGMALLRVESAVIRRSVLYRAPSIREALDQSAARLALAAYTEGGDPTFAALARKTLKANRESESAWSAFQLTLGAALDACEGRRAKALSSLAIAAEQLEQREAPLLALYAKRYRAQLLGDTSELSRLDAELRRQGVVNPARWAFSQIPARPG